MSDPVPVLHDLGDPTRIRVLQTILAARRNVSEIVSRLGLSQPQVSYHLRRLREAGLAVEEKDGRWVWYQANWGTRDPRARELLELLARWSRVEPGAKDAGAKRAQRPRRPVVERPPKKPADMDDFLL
jgi:ArsR family transcriptional regulator, arsenate/arsenite/antimonite-responsive transcriptional repressor